VKKILRLLYYSLPKALHSRWLFPCRNYVFEVTYHCNLDCRMCSFLQEIELKKKEITPRRELTCGDFLAILGRLPRGSNVSFTGGEPFTKKGFMDMLREAKRRGHAVTLGTNGVLLTEEICRELVALGIDRIGVSIDGPRELHDSIRRKPNAFDGVTAAVKNLRAARDRAGSSLPVVMVNTVVLPENYHVIPDVVALTREIGADHYCIEAIDGSLERSSSRLRDDIEADLNPVNGVPEITGDEFRTILERAFDTARALNLHMAISPPGMTIDDMVRYYRRQFTIRDWQCAVPWEVCRISPYGDVYPCMNYKIGNLREKSLYSLWTSERYHKFRNLFPNDRIRPCCIGCCKTRKKDTRRNT
jgi:radical SAM protein with 4Fe4S-binding SPASM domain